jgi:hypothetical protein
MGRLSWSPEVTTETEFRSADQEVIKLLEECSELKRTLRTVSAQLGRIENRVRAAFPVASKIVRERNSAASKQKASSLAPDQALAEFDHIVKLASSGATVDAENYVERKSASDLYAIAKEVGVIFQNNKPSIKTMREAILGRVRESILLSRHSPREQS